MQQETILTLLKKPTSLIATIAVAILLFDIQFYLLKVFPGNINQSCYPGAYFTPFNLFFAFILSVLIAINLIGFIHLIRSKIRDQLAITGSLTFVGLILGSLTSFCTFCVLPVISLFGISISLTFFSDHIELFKLLSFAAIVTSTYLLNKQITRNCSSCKN